MAKKKEESLTKYRARSHMLLLYPDNPQHFDAMEKISQAYSYGAILHDRDEWTEEDEAKNPEHKVGTYKKEHWHVVVNCANAVWNTALAKELNIEEKFVEKTKDLDSALLYLIHYNDPQKAPYSLEEVFGGLHTRLADKLMNMTKSEGEKVAELIEYIVNYNGRLTVTDFAKHCALNGYWAEFRRSGAIFCKMIEEHNTGLQAAVEGAREVEAEFNSEQE